ncbi:MAG: tetratricopeptide repeat protein [Verrucomicrobia bacterium]|nr:tetratricopeptide repeat protein [Verrucomicrobiota bacterium]
MKPIQPPDRHFLLAAQGWLELGNQTEAFKELRKISPEFTGHPEVIKARWKLYSEIKGEKGTQVIADIISELDLSSVLSQVHRTRGFNVTLRRPRPSGETVMASLKLPLLFAVPYNLACYACQLGNLKEAWEWLQVAVELCDAEEIRNLALNDTDLEPLWDQIREL